MRNIYWPCPTNRNSLCRIPCGNSQELPVLLREVYSYIELFCEGVEGNQYIESKHSEKRSEIRAAAGGVGLLGHVETQQGWRRWNAPAFVKAIAFCLYSQEFWIIFHWVVRSSLNVFPNWVSGNVLISTWGILPRRYLMILRDEGKLKMENLTNRPY